MRIARLYITLALVILVSSEEPSTNEEAPSHELKKQVDDVRDLEGFVNYDENNDTLKIATGSPHNDEQLPILPPIILLDFAEDHDNSSSLSADGKSKRTIDNNLGYGFARNNLFTGKYNYYFPAGKSGTSVSIEESISPFLPKTIIETIKPITEKPHGAETSDNVYGRNPLLKSNNYQSVGSHQQSNSQTIKTPTNHHRTSQLIFGQRTKLYKPSQINYASYQSSTPKSTVETYTTPRTDYHINSQLSDHNSYATIKPNFQSNSYSNGFSQTTQRPNPSYSTSSPQAYVTPLASYQTRYTPNSADSYSTSGPTEIDAVTTPRPAGPAYSRESSLESFAHLPRYTIENGVRYENKIVWKYPDGKISHTPPSSYVNAYNEYLTKQKPTLGGSSSIYQNTGNYQNPGSASLSYQNGGSAVPYQSGGTGSASLSYQNAGSAVPYQSGGTGSASALYQNGGSAEAYQTLGTGSASSSYQNGGSAETYQTLGTGSASSSYQNGGSAETYQTPGTGSASSSYQNGGSVETYQSGGSGSASLSYQNGGTAGRTSYQNPNYQSQLIRYQVSQKEPRYPLIESFSNIHSKSPAQFPKDQETGRPLRPSQFVSSASLSSGNYGNAFRLPQPSLNSQSYENSYQGQYGEKTHPRGGASSLSTSGYSGQYNDDSTSPNDSYESTAYEEQQPVPKYAINSPNPEYTYTTESSLMSTTPTTLFTPKGDLSPNVLSKYSNQAQKYLTKVFSADNTANLPTDSSAEIYNTTPRPYVTGNYDNLLNYNPSLTQYIRNPSSILNARPTFIQAGNSLIPVIILRVDGASPIRPKTTPNINLKALLQQYLTQYAGRIGQNANYDIGNYGKVSSVADSNNRQNPLYELTQLAQNLAQYSDDPTIVNHYAKQLESGSNTYDTPNAYVTKNRYENHVQNSNNGITNNYSGKTSKQKVKSVQIIEDPRFTSYKVSS